MTEETEVEIFKWAHMDTGKNGVRYGVPIMAAMGFLHPSYYVTYEIGKWTRARAPIFAYRTVADAIKAWGPPSPRRGISLWRCLGTNPRPIRKVLPFDVLKWEELLDQFWTGDTKPHQVIDEKASIIVDTIKLIEEILPEENSDERQAYRVEQY